MPRFACVMLLPMTVAALRPDPVATFCASMPARYRELFDAAAAREHAAIAARRAGEPAHVEIWRRLSNGGAVVCVVADDRPGLLSFISAALVVHMMDVVAAQVYTRSAPEGPEAVDFFWLRREGAVKSPVLLSDASGIASVLRALITRELTIDAITRETGTRPAPPPGASTCVTFEDLARTGMAVLTVETFDRPGLLLAITKALSRARVQIIASEVMSRDDRVVDRFTIVELDGAPLRENRRGILRVEVLAAIDAVVRGEP
jgi:[protein-PII] uridylyltransferase